MKKAQFMELHDPGIKIAMQGDYDDIEGVYIQFPVDIYAPGSSVLAQWLSRQLEGRSDVCPDDLKLQREYQEYGTSLHITSIEAEVMGPQLIDIWITLDGDSVEYITYSGSFSVLWENQ